ncbi:MAG: hypothetical protein HGA45_43185 [Chloroflexales bacterium]|nr:hypothetical protein [Chloroflexales bacterium]
MKNTTLAALLEATFGSPAHPLAAWYAGLLAEAPPLYTFTAANATKIRKKVRHARTPEAQRDLRCELAVAAALIDRRSPLTYEPLAAKGRRGPDFLLRHKGHTDVYVEVSRLRPARGEDHDADRRLAAVLCGKLGQLALGAANLLIVVSDADAYAAADVGAILQGLRRRAEAKDDAYFAFRGLDGAQALHQTLPRLSGVLIVTPAAPAEALFIHQQARHPLPADLARADPAWGLTATIGPLPN